jgi:predicted HicB family RNase H-like nuclease
MVRRERVDDDWCFVGRVAEFPDVAVYEDDARTAYAATRQVVDDLLQLLGEQGSAPPRPQKTNDEFSGRVTFRMPRSMHARVDRQATSEGVSVNTLLIAAVENYLSVRESANCSAGPVVASQVIMNCQRSNFIWSKSAHRDFLVTASEMVEIFQPDQQTWQLSQSCSVVRQSNTTTGIALTNAPTRAYKSTHSVRTLEGND